VVRRIEGLTTTALAALLAGDRPVAVLVPVGSVEPHGPHLGLSTDTIISDEVALRAAERLSTEGRVRALVGPAVPYGVTEVARGFAGAVSVPAPTLTAFLRAVVEGYLGEGFAHVCFVNNHLEPAQDAAVRAAVAGLAPGRASVACPLERRWGRTLSAEYKSGACHAGRYETSLVLAAAPALVDAACARALPPLAVSLSREIAAGKRTFLEMGMPDAYTGAPAEATEAEGEALLDRLADMVVTVVSEALATLRRQSRCK
jgi:creatinine amidohydrolase